MTGSSPWPSSSNALETNFEDTSTSPSGPAIREMCLHAPEVRERRSLRGPPGEASPALNIVVKELRKHQTRPGQGYGGYYRPGDGPHDLWGHLRCHAGRPEGGYAAQWHLLPGPVARDVSGPTAAIKSVACLEHLNLVQGTIFNMKVHPASLEVPGPE